ncbi:hypothetical protein FACS1894110_25920 [Spirochaetia bacterium]|nr:hypothetical protein FACS1894110_25920 [Spirochaetia bacterium]
MVGPFKPSIHRKWFIDKKIRENAYPTAVSLAEDYQKEYGESIDPRSIAADIAALRQEFHAPISYDYQHRGYFYTDPAFHPAILPDDSGVLLSDMAGKIQPKTQFIPDWHKNLLSAILNKALPVSKEADTSAGKVSMLLNAPSGQETDRKGPLRSLLEALDSYREVKLRYVYSGIEPVTLIFQPIHFIYTPESHLIFGGLRNEQGIRYGILHGERIEELTRIDTPVSQPASSALPRESGFFRGSPPDYVYVQTAEGQDIEVLISKKWSDLLLVFTLQPGTGRKKTLAEYALLAQTEIYPIPQPIYK